MARLSGPAKAILLSLERLFKLDNVTRIASVELCVLLTTLLLVVRFLIDFKGPWFGNPRKRFVVLTLEALNQNMVIYTMGLMQLSGARKVNDYFQVWAVLLVTLKYSVKIGRPYTRSKQVPLLDLMSSFWSANLLRVQTFYLLRIPLWTIWSLNAARIIMLFVSSGEGETSNQESMRLVSDYMSYEDTLSSSTSTLLDEQEKESTMSMAMSGYKYLVYGEHRVLKQVQDQESISSSSYKIQLDPDGVHKEQLVTIETIWKDDSGGLLGGAGEAAGRRRDLCLSFALYKLLRRRFFDLPMHELCSRRGKEKMRRLIFDYVLVDRERAFRITGTQLSFLEDLFYSKHATVFAGGVLVPLQSLVLSLCLAAAAGYIAYPARYIPERMDPADRNRITHGVFVTRLMVGIIVLKEMLEVVLYLCSRWAKVLMICVYVQHRCLRRPAAVVEGVMRLFMQFCSRCSLTRCCFCRCKAAKWTNYWNWNRNRNQTVLHQQNLLVTVRLLRPVPVHISLKGIGPVPLSLTVRMVNLRGVIFGTAGLEDYTKDAILDQLKRLENRREGIEIVDSYFANAFGRSSNTNTASDDDGKVVVEWPCNLRKVDTHIILVWHIATSLCEIYFFNKVRELRAVVRRPRGPLVEDPKGQEAAAATPHTKETNGSSSASPAGPESAAWSEHYATAVTLSNYCVHLVKKALVPDNRFVAWKVLEEVVREINYVIVGNRIHGPREKLLRSIKLEDVYKRLMKTVDWPCKNPDHRHQGRERDPAADVEEASTPPAAEHHQVEGDNNDDDKYYKDYDKHDIGCSLTRMGAVLGKKLTEVYHGDAAGLWRDLANFWTGFLLHLAANTGAATHARHLAGDSELITHLWALLTHAGYRGSAVHGEQGLDKDDIPDIDQHDNQPASRQPMHY